MLTFKEKSEDKNGSACCVEETVMNCETKKQSLNIHVKGKYILKQKIRDVDKIHKKKRSKRKKHRLRFQKIIEKQEVWKQDKIGRAWK